MEADVFRTGQSVEKTKSAVRCRFAGDKHLFTLVYQLAK